jgi:osmotically-inducible protein OsmY
MSQQLTPDETNAHGAGNILYTLAHQVILENAGRRLRHSSYPQLWRITCEFFEGVLTLRGVVGSYFIKQLAHAAVFDVVGVDEVANRLEVQYPEKKSNNRSH